tara:strand:- start:119 stop:283 length:165 start_codon:yes stop_codon:yes gene_type:complete
MVRGIGSAVVVVEHVLELLALDMVEDLEVLTQVVVEECIRQVRHQLQSLIQRMQ